MQCILAGLRRRVEVVLHATATGAALTFRIELLKFSLNETFAVEGAILPLTLLPSPFIAKEHLQT